MHKAMEAAWQMPLFSRDKQRFMKQMCAPVPLLSNGIVNSASQQQMGLSCYQSWGDSMIVP